MRRREAKRTGLCEHDRAVWRGGWAVSMVLSIACFTESSDDDDGGSAPTTAASTSANASATDGPADGSADDSADGSATTTNTTTPSTSAAVDSTGASAATDDDAGTTSETSDSTGEPVFEPCPELIEPFDRCPGAPWMSNGAGRLACDGDAVLVVSAAVDGNVQLVVPLGFVNASAVVDLVDAPATGMLKMLRIRTPGMEILAFRINGTDDGPVLEAYVDDMGATSVLASAPYDPIAHRWVRVRETGGELAFEVSADGLGFAAFHEAVTPFDLTDATVGIAAGNYQPLGADMPVAFGQFEYYCTGNPQ